MKLIIRLAVVLSLWSGPASAADSVETLLEQGATCMEKADYLCALDLFQRADKIQESSRTLAQVGLAEQALERWPEAERHLSLALMTTDERWVERRRRVLEDSLARVRTHLATLTITGSPPGAEVFLDDKFVGALPLKRSLRVAAGSHQIAVRAPLHTPIERATQVVAGSQVAESFDLLAESAVPAAAPVSASGAAVAMPVPTSTREPAPAWRRTLGVVAVGAGASLSTLGGFLMWLDGKPQSLNSNKAYDLRVQGPVTLAAGGLILASGIVALAWPGPASTNVAVTPTGVQLSGTF
jgi:hypothetical protein